MVHGVASRRPPAAPDARPTLSRAGLAVTTEAPLTWVVDSFRTEQGRERPGAPLSPARHV